MIEITDIAIDVREVEDAIHSDSDGGLVTFCGVVRGHSGDGRQVLGLVYEAHEEMALAEFERIAGEAVARFGDLRIALVHRVGSLAVGEIAVVVAVSAPHRAEAFGACEYAIDELKARATIWKKELYVDGRAEWVENICEPRTGTQ